MANSYYVKLSNGDDVEKVLEKAIKTFDREGSVVVASDKESNPNQVNYRVYLEGKEGLIQVSKKGNGSINLYPTSKNTNLSGKVCKKVKLLLEEPVKASDVTIVDDFHTALKRDYPNLYLYCDDMPRSYFSFSIMNSCCMNDDDYKILSIWRGMSSFLNIYLTTIGVSRKNLSRFKITDGLLAELNNSITDRELLSKVLKLYRLNIEVGDDLHEPEHRLMSLQNSEFISSVIEKAMNLMESIVELSNELR